MERFASSLFCLLALGQPVSCAVISSETRSEADPPVAFSTLVDQADRYVGRTVILGGYILETRNKKSETVRSIRGRNSSSSLMHTPTPNGATLISGTATPFTTIHTGMGSLVC